MGEHDVKSGEICQVLLHCDNLQSACGDVTYDSLIDRLLVFDHGGVLLADLFCLGYPNLKSTAEFCMQPAEIRSQSIFTETCESLTYCLSCPASCQLF